MGLVQNAADLGRGFVGAKYRFTEADALRALKIEFNFLVDHQAALRGWRETGANESTAAYIGREADFQITDSRHACCRAVNNSLAVII